MSPSAEELRAAEGLIPAAVGSYLTGAGWRPRDTAIGASLWTLTDGSDEFEVLLPTDQRLRDFGLRMFDLLGTLAVVEGRPISSILIDLTNVNSDTLTFRLLPGGPPGTIPLFNGADAIQGIRELLVASTYASTLPRPLLVQGRRPKEVQEFARMVRLGTPRAGSWVVAAQLAMPEAEVASAIDGVLPFARRVSLSAHRSVGATLTAAVEALSGDPLEPFLRRADEGVSANMCEALAKLGRDDTPFEVRFVWAQRLPARPGTDRFQFSPEVIRATRDAGEGMRSFLVEGRVEVTGVVSRLSRDAGEVATAVIDGIVRSHYGEAEQKIRVRLASAPHFAAIEAYRTQRVVRLVGEARRGQVEAVLSIEAVRPQQRPEDKSNQRSSNGDQ